MKPFKFLTGTKIQQRNVEIFTRFEMSRFIISIDLYGHILNLGLYIHHGRQFLNHPNFYIDENDGWGYYYRVTEITPPYGNMITIDYEILFPETARWRQFTTTSRV